MPRKPIGPIFPGDSLREILFLLSGQIRDRSGKRGIDGRGRCRADETGAFKTSARCFVELSLDTDSLVKTTVYSTAMGSFAAFNTVYEKELNGWKPARSVVEVSAAAEKRAGGNRGRGMQMKQEYEVKLDLFEGPLDLLLYLVNRAEVDIVQIPVAQIAQQYIEYLDLMRELNIDVAAEYLYMASTLIRLKARELLPPVEGETIEQEEGIYNRQQLIAQLLEYKKYKEAAFSLRHFEAEQIGCFTRGSAEPVHPAFRGRRRPCRGRGNGVRPDHRLQARARPHGGRGRQPAGHRPRYGAS